MKFKLQFNCDNAAFDDLSGEIAQILRNVAHTVADGMFENGRKVLPVRDSNGNTVGQAQIMGRAPMKRFHV